MNQNFSKVNFYTNQINWRIFNGGKNFGGTDLGGGGGILDLSKVQASNNYHICNLLDWG